MIEVKVSGLSALLARLGDNRAAIGRASRNAENSTATAVRKVAFVEASKIFNIKENRLRYDSRGRVTYYVQRSSVSSPGAVVVFKGGDNPKAGFRPGLQHYKVDKQERNKKEKGWTPTIQIRRGGPVERVEHAFYGVGTLQGQGIFQRQIGVPKDYTQKNGKVRKGERIVRRTGPSIVEMIRTATFARTLRRQGETILRQKLIEAIDKQSKKTNPVTGVFID